MPKSKLKIALLVQMLLLTACAKPSPLPISVQVPPAPPQLMGPPPGPFLPSAQADIETWQKRLTGSAPPS